MSFLNALLNKIIDFTSSHWRGRTFVGFGTPRAPRVLSPEGGVSAAGEDGELNFCHFFRTVFNLFFQLLLDILKHYCSMNISLNRIWAIFSRLARAELAGWDHLFPGWSTGYIATGRSGLYCMGIQLNIRIVFNLFS